MFTTLSYRHTNNEQLNAHMLHSASNPRRIRTESLKTYNKGALSPNYLVPTIAHA
jgi:hypothetical protein